MKEYAKINKSGGLNIPVRLRREFGINSGDAVTIEPLEDGGFKIKPYTDKCCFCGETEKIRYLHGKGICFECVEEACRITLEAEIDASPHLNIVEEMDKTDKKGW